jgi:predicted CoA-binding protein
MTTQSSVETFLEAKNIAVVGVSRKKSKFGNVIYRELKKKGINTFGVNPNLENIEGDKCFSNLKVLQGKVNAVVGVVSPSQTLEVVKEANKIGVKNFWMQQGSESKEAIKFCIDNGINVIHNQCILMFAEPVKSIHSFHRWVWKVLGKLPK